MYEYIKGIVTSQYANYISLENNGIGYKIYVPSPYKFILNDEYTIYTYSHIREDENTLYGFSSYEERELFLKLIDVKGMGPKMAIVLLASSSVNGVIDAIDRENILYLKKIPKIGDKLARQIILDLKGKLVKSDNETVNKDDELTMALVSLGYKPADIKKVVSKVDKELSIDKQIKEALKLLLNN